MKKRHYYYYFSKEPIEGAGGSVDSEGAGGSVDSEGAGGSVAFDDGEVRHFRTIEVDCRDELDDAFTIFAFPVEDLDRIGELVGAFYFKVDTHELLQQCRDLIAVPEKHQSAEGRDGKINFQAVFHAVPTSLQSINSKARVAIVLETGYKGRSPNDDAIAKVVGYLHINPFRFTNVGAGVGYLNGHYVTLLRVSDSKVDGVEVYRRAGIFSSLFAVLIDLAKRDQVQFVYAATGKENQAINRGLKKLTETYGGHWDTVSMTANFRPLRLYGKAKYQQHLVDISGDIRRIRELYDASHARTRMYLFNQYPTFDDFYHQYAKIVAYSKTSGAYMIQGPGGEMKSAAVVINWGDYFSFVLEEPKGLFALLAKTGLTNQLLHVWMTMGDPEWVDKLYRGIAMKYRSEHDVRLGVFTSYPGDPYAEIKRSMLKDHFNYFVIHENPEVYDDLKAASRDAHGNARIFVDTPIL